MLVFLTTFRSLRRAGGRGQRGEAAVLAGAEAVEERGLPRVLVAADEEGEHLHAGAAHVGEGRGEVDLRELLVVEVHVAVRGVLRVPHRGRHDRQGGAIRVVHTRSGASRTQHNVEPGFSPSCCGEVLSGIRQFEKRK